MSSFNQVMAGLRPPHSATMRAAEMERRASLRVEQAFTATVRGVDADGRRFEEHGVLDNLSACGLQLRLGHPVLVGTRLFVCARLSLAERSEAELPHIALRGVVVRVQRAADERCAVAIEFERHRFLYAHIS